MTIAADAGGSDGSLTQSTVVAYLNSRERLMIIEDLPAWAPELRSRARLRTAATRHFVDPCLAVAALNGSPAKLLKDLNFFGLLFESLVVRDLRVYTQHSGSRLSHYRDSDDLEVDVIIETEDERWARSRSSWVTHRRAQKPSSSQTRPIPNAVATRVLAVVTLLMVWRADGVYVLPIGTPAVIR